jgi:PAS domain S-box-containing protein
MSNTKVLIVEDETIVAMDIKNRLENLKYIVTATAFSGEDAIKLTAETCPDIVLMDIMLDKNMDGVEVAEKIRELFGIPVIYLTAYADEKTLSRAKLTKPFGYILKPFEEMELHAAIEIAIYNHDLERELNESKKWLHAALNSIGDAVIATDKEGIIKLINPFAQAITGWKEEDAFDKPLGTIFNVINGDAGEKAEDPRIKVIREGIFYGLASNTILIRNDGKEIPVDIIGSTIKDDRENIIGLIFTFYDITERKRSGREKDKFLKAFASCTDGITIADENDRFIYVNEAYAGIFGYHQEELIGNTWHKITPPELIAPTEKGAYPIPCITWK